jgi:hypothetical protein
LQTFLAEVDSMALPTSQLGCEFLDCLKLVGRICEKAFSKAKELLLPEPNAIANWHVSEAPQRVLSRDTTALRYGKPIIRPHRRAI